MTDKLILFLYIMGGLALIFAEFCADSYDAGVRSGYDKGLEDGIRMTNEVLEEDQRDVDCSWR